MKKATALLLLLMLGLTLLAGCGGNDTTLTGKYKLTSMELDGEDFLADLDEYGWEASDLYQLEFLSGGKCKVMSYGEEESVTFKVSGKTVKLDFGEGDVWDGTIDGDKLNFSQKGDLEIDGYSSAKMVFVKG
jgi:hypothetical protein